MFGVPTPDSTGGKCSDVSRVLLNLLLVPDEILRVLLNLLLVPNEIIRVFLNLLLILDEILRILLDLLLIPDEILRVGLNLLLVPDEILLHFLHLLQKFRDCLVKVFAFGSFQLYQKKAEKYNFHFDFSNENQFNWLITG